MNIQHSYSAKSICISQDTLKNSIIFFFAEDNIYCALMSFYRFELLHSCHLQTSLPVLLSKPLHCTSCHVKSLDHTEAKYEHVKNNCAMLLSPASHNTQVWLLVIPHLTILLCTSFHGPPHHSQNEYSFGKSKVVTLQSPPKYFLKCFS